MQAATARSSFVGSAAVARPAAAARLPGRSLIVRAGPSAQKDNPFAEELKATAKYIAQVKRGVGDVRARARSPGLVPDTSSVPGPMQRGRGILASDESNATTGVRCSPFGTCVGRWHRLDAGTTALRTACVCLSCAALTFLLHPPARPPLRRACLQASAWRAWAWRIPKTTVVIGGSFCIRRLGWASTLAEP